MNIKTKRNIVRAIGMLNTIKENKWSKEEKIIRTLSAFDLAKHYLKIAEEEFELYKSKKK